MERFRRLDDQTLFGENYLILSTLREDQARRLYLAEQISTRTAVLLETFSPDVIPAFEDREAFVASLRRTHDLASDHIVLPWEAGIDAATSLPWTATPCADGSDLAGAIEKHVGPWPLPIWDEVLTQLCRAMNALHQAGLVHAGLAPDTVFLSLPGRDGAPFHVLLLDVALPPSVQVLANQSPRHVPWLAPEQLQGASPDARSDVWTLGLLAFVLYTGVPYWRAKDSVASVREEILRAPLEAASMRAKALGAPANFPSAFDAWFQRCVARSPNDRFANAHLAFEAATELLAQASNLAEEDIKETAAVAPPPLPPMVRAIAENPRPAIAALVVLVALALLGGMGLGGFLRPKEKGVASAAARVRALTWARGSREACEKACRGGDPVACQGLAQMYREGLKVARDDQKSAELFGKACDAGDAPSCGGLAAQYFLGEGVVENKATAPAFYQRACAGRDSFSWMDLVDLLRQGSGVPKDESKAKVMLKRACTAGITEACE